MDTKMLKVLEEIRDNQEKFYTYTEEMKKENDEYKREVMDLSLKNQKTSRRFIVAFLIYLILTFFLGAVKF